MPRKFDWHAIEKKWQKRWEWAKVHETNRIVHKPKYFVTAAYPYPNSPQHIGHGRSYTLADVNARYHRMKGFNTLFPMGFHYTGNPIFAMAKRLGEKDPEIVRTFTKLYGVPESQLGRLVEPVDMARYFHQEIKRGMVEIGFSIDWRREFTTIDPIYSRFIEWHFGKLKAKGLITTGTHPVGWCPNDNQPVGMHDTRGDVEPEIGEQFLVKFEKDGVYYPTATLRPETAFGVTNLWVNPQPNYVQARVDGERWVVTTEAVEKLRHQNHKIESVEVLDAKGLLWKQVVNPVTKARVPILPAGFVEPGNGTGIVMSVPAHAPYDYQALVDLKTQALGSDESAIVVRLKPVSIIRLDGFSDIPAAGLVEKFAIRDQKDPKLDAATKELYSAEFHRGIMKENTGSYSGMTVAEARAAIVLDYSRLGSIAKMYEITNRPVICRCGWECLVHIFENQWFINYGDAEWKKLAHGSLDRILLLPEESRNEFNYAIDWLKEKACARKVGLGTRLPWDKDWVIEALSDSVIYMAYYILAKYLSQNWITFKKFEKDPSRLSDQFFDYVFLGEGDAKSVSVTTGVPMRIVEEIHKEFLYFYPVDMRHSAKDLIPNHLTFYLFQHAVLFPLERRPKGIVANGFVMMEGMKMSKSLENIIPLRQGVTDYGADPVRMGVLATAELGQDTDFSQSLVVSLQERLFNLISQARKLGKTKQKRGKFSSLDRWMLSQLNGTVRLASDSMERLRVREVINQALYQLDNDLSWYQIRLGPKKGGKDNRLMVMRRVMETRARILAPVAPHTTEEIWSLLGNKGLIAKASWPEVDAKADDSGLEQEEFLVRQILEDTGEILKATGMTAKQVVYYTAADWKWQIYLKALDYYDTREGGRGDFIKEIMSDPEFRKLGKAAADYAARVAQQIRQSSSELRKERMAIGRLSENRILEDAGQFFGAELGAKVQVYGENDSGIYDPKGRAQLAEPYRPAILIE